MDDLFSLVKTKRERFMSIKELERDYLEREATRPDTPKYKLIKSLKHYVRKSGLFFED